MIFDQSYSVRVWSHGSLGAEIRTWNFPNVKHNSTALLVVSSHLKSLERIMKVNYESRYIGKDLFLRRNLKRC